MFIAQASKKGAKIDNATRKKTNKKFDEKIKIPQLNFFEQYKKLKFIMLSLIYSFELFSPRHFTFKQRKRLKRKRHS